MLYAAHNMFVMGVLVLVVYEMSWWSVMCTKWVCSVLCPALMCAMIGDACGCCLLCHAAGPVLCVACCVFRAVSCVW